MHPILLLGLAGALGYVVYKKYHQYSTPLGQGSPVSVTTADGTKQTQPYLLDANMSDFQKTEFVSIYDSLGQMDPNEAISLAVRSAGTYKDGGFPIASRLMVDVALRLAAQMSGTEGLSPYRAGPAGAMLYTDPGEGHQLILDYEHQARVPSSWIDAVGGLQLPPGTPVLLGNATADGQWAEILVAFPPTPDFPSGAADSGYGRVNDFTFGI